MSLVAVVAATLLGCSGTATVLPTGQPVPQPFYPAALALPPGYAPSPVVLPPPRP